MRQHWICLARNVWDRKVSFILLPRTTRFTVTTIIGLVLIVPEIVSASYHQPLIMKALKIYLTWLIAQEDFTVIAELF